MKHRLTALGLGLLSLAAVYGFMTRVSLDMRWVFAIGAGALFAAALWLGRSPRAGVLTWLLLCLPLLSVFGYVALREFGAIWPHLPLWACAAGVGLAVARAIRLRPAVAVAAVALLALGCAWYFARYLPDAVSRALSRYPNDPAPVVTLRDLDGAPIEPAAWKGKVVVLDFFSTWCAPCVAEMPELQQVSDRLRSRPDVVFLVIANDSGGDTPASVQSFARRRSISMPFAWDPGSKVRDAFGCTGLPALVVLDRAGRIRLVREGYNAADVNFGSNLEKFVGAL